MIRLENRLGCKCVRIMLLIILVVPMVSCGVRDKIQTNNVVGSFVPTKEAQILEASTKKVESGDMIAQDTPALSAEQQGQGENKTTEQQEQGEVKITEQIRDGEELKLIQAQYQLDNSDVITGFSFFSYPEYIEEIDIPELYEKTKMKAYRAYANYGKHAGNYLLYERTVLSSLDPFEEICIADIDQNGVYELLSLYGFGSGIYRNNLNVYQVANPIYFSSLTKILHLQYRNCFIPKTGFGKLRFDQVSDSEVHLKDVNVHLKNGDVETYEIGKDYGKLVIDKDRIHITLENLEDFPYEVWDDVYNQENWKIEDFDYETLSEIPDLEVTIGDTVIKNASYNRDWKGDEDERIDFSELITEDIPLFAPPEEFTRSDQEICLNFRGVIPTSIQVMDSLITDAGKELYSGREALDLIVREEKKGSYCFRLEPHPALFLSSNTASYTNPSYRGFRVICEFGKNRSCEYVFVLAMGPLWVTAQP